MVASTLRRVVVVTARRRASARAGRAEPAPVLALVAFVLALVVLFGATAGTAHARVAEASAVEVDAGPDASSTACARALAAYRRTDYATARTEWLAALDGTAGYERARILHDLGNVAFRQGRPLEAVGWYTASLRLRPRDADTWANLEEARGRAKLEPADRGDLSSTLERALRSFTSAEARWTALGGLALLAAALAWEALRGGRLARAGAVVAACVALFLCGPWLHQVAHRADDPVLVVNAQGTSVRSEPRAKAAVIAEFAPGVTAQRVDEVPDWTKVRLDDGREGWVASDAVFRLRR